MIRATITAAALLLAAPATAAPLSATIVSQEACDLITMGQPTQEAITAAISGNRDLVRIDLETYGRKAFTLYTANLMASRCGQTILRNRGGQI